MSISSVILLLANAVPLLGVIFWGWDTVLVLALFWIENLIIGFFNVVRMIWASAVQKQSKGVFLVLFFLVHYGAFCAVHGTVLAQLLDQEVSVSAVLGMQVDGLVELFLEGVAVLVHFLQTLAPAIWLGLGALALSRLVSFIENFLLKGEVFNSNPQKLMTRPYQQIIVMHAGLIGGAFLLQKLGSPVWLLALIVVLKMGVDYVQFRRRYNDEIGEKIKDI